MGANTIKSFDNVVSSLLNICRDHPFVNQVEHGDPWEISPDGGVIYPLCMVVPTSINALDSQVQYNFNIICMDLVEPGEDNELRVLSQTSRILLDIIAWFKRGGRAFSKGGSTHPYQDTNPFYDYTNEIQTTYTLEPFTEKFTDNVSGWNMQFSITMQYDYSVCAWDGKKLNITSNTNTSNNNTVTEASQNVYTE